MKAVRVEYKGEPNEELLETPDSLAIYLGKFNGDIVVVDDNGKPEHLIFKDGANGLYMYGMYNGELCDYFNYDDVADVLIDDYFYKKNYRKAEVTLTYSFE